ncbi:hypothetical protein GCM10027578_45320 [Spirosoma luteolum]
MKDLIEAYLNAYNRKDVAGMLAVVHDDIRFENVSNSGTSMTLTGKQALEQQAEQFLAVFSERNQAITSLIVAGNRAAAEIDYRATVAQDLPNGWKANQSITLHGVSIFESRDGRLCRISDYS